MVLLLCLLCYIVNVAVASSASAASAGGEFTLLNHSMVTDLLPLIHCVDGSPSVISHHPIVHKWASIITSDYIIANLDNINGVKTYNTNDTLYYRYYSVLEDVPPTIKCEQVGCWIEPESLPPTSPSELLSLIQQTESTTFSSWSISPEHLVGLEKVIPKQYLREKLLHDQTTVAQLWLSGAGTVTPLHYDHDINVVFQLTGRKRWHVYHQSKVDQFNFFPASSPHNRCVIQKNPAEPDYIFDLGPGEILVLPPFSLHRVECLDTPCISINVWFIDEIRSMISKYLVFAEWWIATNTKKLLKNQDNKSVPNLKHLLLECVTELIQGAEPAVEWLKKHLVPSFSALYQRVPPIIGCDQPPSISDDNWKPAEFARSLRKRLRDVPHSVQNVIIATIVERFAAALVEAENLPSFIFCLVE